MKFACALLVLSVVFAAPQKRVLLDTIFDNTQLKTLVTGLAHTAGSNETEKACEAECHVLIHEDHLLQFGCPLVCKSLQSLVHRFNVR